MGPVTAPLDSAVGNVDKDGPLRFRELLRFFGGACIDEYYKNGVWDMETLALDTQLIEAHLEQAGVSDFPDLDFIPEVVLPDPWSTDESSSPTAANRGTKRPLEDTKGSKKGKGKKATQAAAEKGSPKGKGLLPSGKGMKATGKGSKDVSTAAKGVQLVGKGPELKGKGSQLLGKASGKAAKGLSNAVALHRAGLDPKGATKGSKWTPAEVQHSGKGSKKGAKGLTNGLQGTPAWAKAAPKGLEKGAGKGKSVGKGLHKGSQNGVPYANSKAGAPVFSKAGSAQHRPVLGKFGNKFAKRAARGVTASKEVVEAVLDADFLD